jgi:hypothetical protein
MIFIKDIYDICSTRWKGAGSEDVQELRTGIQNLLCSPVNTIHGLPTLVPSLLVACPHLRRYRPGAHRCCLRSHGCAGPGAYQRDTEGGAGGARFPVLRKNAGPHRGPHHLEARRNRGVDDL